MTARPQAGPGNAVAAVVVTYHPDGAAPALIEELSRQCQWVIVVDNGSTGAELEPIRRACGRTGAQLVANGENLGIAAAQNTGIARARDLGARWVLLSDDDSAPRPGMVASLLEAFAASQAPAPTGAAPGSSSAPPGPRPGAEPPGPTAAVGPLVGEEREGRDQLVYVPRRWGPRRATPQELDQPLLSVAFLVASGCLISMDALDRVGGMNEDLFIDHVDLEWGLRARREGYELYVATRTTMAHSLGDAVVRLPGRAQPIHVHAPVRNYYLARNTIALIGSGLLPMAWRVGYLVWMAKYAAFNALLAPPRRQRARALAQGIAHGLRGRLGPRPS
ncbi:glycosyltransferase family 2 protein [Actinomyces bowdenii]|uniref:glycosyltransferase family 2 protein n=1 Tax=Actinomyces bowdenii TaxID=131109 RepID=UPI00214C46C6|nr:glycosyltransferase family 2 protein [Actinomyces bowdenii]MCR2053701.1 glycosyltransferase family 2 protein [Actinomyces bowdenii]